MTTKCILALVLISSLKKKTRLTIIPSHKSNTLLRTKPNDYFLN